MVPYEPSSNDFFGNHQELSEKSLRKWKRFLKQEEEHKLRKRREIGESRNELINKQVLRLLKCEVASTYVLLLELSELEYFEEILRIYHKFVKAINKKDGQIHLNTSDGSYIGR